MDLAGNSTLISFWAEKLNKKSLHAYQVSARKGELFCEYCIDRVNISEKVVIYLIGEIFI